MRHLTIAVLLSLAGLASAAPAASTASARSGEVPIPLDAQSWERVMSRSMVLGFQLAIQHGFDTGKASQGVLDCANRVDADYFVPL